jgi:hypothetical protein
MEGTALCRVRFPAAPRSDPACAANALGSCLGYERRARVGEGTHDLGWRQPSVREAVHARPVQAGALAAAPERPVPVAGCLGAERRDRGSIARTPFPATASARTAVPGSQRSGLQAGTSGLPRCRASITISAESLILIVRHVAEAQLSKQARA